MGIAIPQVITPSKASGAQVIDGSLKFDDTIVLIFKKTLRTRTGLGVLGKRRTLDLFSFLHL